MGAVSIRGESSLMPSLERMVGAQQLEVSALLEYANECMDSAQDGTSSTIASPESDSAPLSAIRKGSAEGFARESDIVVAGKRCTPEARSQENENTTTEPTTKRLCGGN